MACFADVNVSQGSVARCRGIFNIDLTKNLPRNLPVKKLDRLRFDRIMVMSLWHFFDPPCISVVAFTRCALLRGAGKTLLAFLLAHRNNAQRMCEGPFRLPDLCRMHTHPRVPSQTQTEKRRCCRRASVTGRFVRVLIASGECRNTLGRVSATSFRMLHYTTAGCAYSGHFLEGRGIPLPQKTCNSPPAAAKLCALTMFFGRGNELQIYHENCLLTDNKHRKLFVIKHS